ncbi:MAG: nitroreductase family deazaflavin-dependent oxidoreductase [Homoserinimonas sp.]
MNSQPGSSALDPIDSAEDWVAKNIRTYLATDGRKGATMSGAPLLLLTTQGAKSGLWRRCVLIFGERDGDLLIVASTGGAPRHPSWYHNVAANPVVRVQVGGDTFEAVARTASSDEKHALWDQMVELFPRYADYQRKTQREIPVVVLERRTDSEAR